MYLKEALANRLAEQGDWEFVKGRHRKAAEKLLEDVERFLRHNGHDKAADALPTEHRP